MGGGRSGEGGGGRGVRGEVGGRSRKGGEWGGVGRSVCREVWHTNGIAGKTGVKVCTLIFTLLTAHSLCHHSVGHSSCLCFPQGTAVGTLGLRKRNGLSAISTKPLAQVQVQQVRDSGEGLGAGGEGVRSGRGA